MKYLLNILAFLLHHANRMGKDPAFYRIKDMLLKKYGVADGYDIQEIAGKPCYTCGGDGTIEPHFDDGEEDCCRCEGTGWFKHPFYVQLLRYSFAKYRFHLPLTKVYSEEVPEELIHHSVQRIDTYIQHAKVKPYANMCKMILFLLFNFNEFVYRLTPYSWRSPGYWTHQMWRPSHVWLNFKHIISWGIRTRGKNVPLFKDLRERRKLERQHKEAMAAYRLENAQMSSSNEELPF